MKETRDFSTVDKTKRCFTLRLQKNGLENEKINLEQYSPHLSNLHIQEILQQFMAHCKKTIGKKNFPTFHHGYKLNIRIFSLFSSMIIILYISIM